MSDINSEEMRSALFDKDGEWHKEYRDALEQKWNAYTSTPEYAAYAPDERFKSLLELMGRGEQYDRDCTQMHHKNMYTQRISTQVKNEILSKHGLDELHDGGV